MSGKINAAVVGAGYVGRKRHVEGFIGAGARVVAITDCDAARAKSAADEYGIKPFTDYREMFSCMPEIDAVSIAVPNKFHKPAALEAIKAGKHVICDKPLAMNSREAEEIVRRAESRGLVLAMVLQHRFAWRARWLGREIEKGRLGEIYHAKASILRTNSIPRGWFHVKKFSGGGPLIDLGPHLLDLAWTLSGRHEPVSAFGYSYSKLGAGGSWFGDWGVGYESGHGVDTEDFAGGIIRLRGGKTIEIEASWALHIDEPTLQCTFFGDRAGASVYPSASIFARTPGGKLRRSHQPDGKDASPFIDFIKCVKTGSRPQASGEDGLAVMKMIDAIYESAKTGKESLIKK